MIKRFDRVLLLAIVCALILRVLFVVVLSSPQELTGDEPWYHFVAMNILKNHVYVDNLGLEAWRPPGYPLFIAVIYWLTDYSTLAVYYIQAILGALTVGVAFFFVLALGFDRGVARLTALGIAFHPLLILLSGTLYSETLSLFTSLIFLWTCSEFVFPERLSTTWGVKSTALAVLGGLSLASAILIRPGMQYFFALLVIAAALIKPRRVRLARVGLMLVIVAIVLLPWLWRNYSMFHEVVLSTNGGLNLWLGNNPAADGGGGTRVQTPEQDLLESVAWKTSETEWDRVLRSFAIEWVKSNPAQTLSLVGKKLFKLFSPIEYGLRGSATGILTVLVWPPYLFFLFCVLCGVYYSRRKVPRLLLVYAWVGYHIFIVATTFGGTRFSVPLLPVLVLFSAVGLQGLCEDLWKSRLAKVLHAH